PGGRGTALGDHAAVLLLEPGAVGQFAGQQVRLPGVQHSHPAQHLTHDDLDVLVVDVHALGAVDLLDLVHEVLLHRAGAEDPQDLLRIHRTGDELLPDGDVIAVGDQEPGTGR